MNTVGKMDRPPGCRTAKCGIPPSDGDCHTPPRARCVKVMIPRHERAVVTFKEDRIVVGGVHKLSTEHRAECSFKGGIACKTFSLLISLGFLVYPVMKGALAKQCVTRDGDDPNASVAD